MRKSYVKKGLAIGIICLLMLMSVPMGTSNDVVLIDEKEEPLKNGDLIDDVILGCHRTSFAINLILILMDGGDYGTRYIKFRYNNNNDESITLSIRPRVTTLDGTELFYHTWSRTIPANKDYKERIPLTRRHLKDAGYLRGHFNVTLDVYVVDDGSHKTLLYNGFLFNFGALIFNPHGKDITR